MTAPSVARDERTAVCQCFMTLAQGYGMRELWEWTIRLTPLAGPALIGARLPRRRIHENPGDRRLRPNGRFAPQRPGRRGLRRRGRLRRSQGAAPGARRGV